MHEPMDTTLLTFDFARGTEAPRSLTFAPESDGQATPSYFESFPNSCGGRGGAGSRRPRRRSERVLVYWHR
jgi:hypothetical protein